MEITLSDKFINLMDIIPEEEEQYEGQNDQLRKETERRNKNMSALISSYIEYTYLQFNDYLTERYNDEFIS